MNILENLSTELQAVLWGGLSGFALVLGALVGYFANLPHRIVSAIMAFGSGVLISALSFDLMQEAVVQGGLISSLLGFTVGVVLYATANGLVSSWGGETSKTL